MQESSKIQTLRIKQDLTAVFERNACVILKKSINATECIIKISLRSKLFKEFLKDANQEEKDD